MRRKKHPSWKEFPQWNLLKTLVDQAAFHKSVSVSIKQSLSPAPVAKCPCFSPAIAAPDMYVVFSVVSHTR